MTTYDIGSKSLIFKRISMFLQETYMSTLEVSDEYTLDLAKCIYEYLRDFYPNRYKYWYSVLSIPDDFLTTIAKANQKTYYKKEYTNTVPVVWTGNYIPATKNDVWQDNVYYISGPEFSIADIYAIGMQLGIAGDGTPVYNEYFTGIYTYELLGYTKDLASPADILTLTDEQKTYTLNSVVPLTNILTNPELQKLYTQYNAETVARQSGQKTMSDRNYSRIIDKIKFIEDSRAYFANVPNGSSAYEDTQKFIEDCLSWVNKYNIYSWPINETILQFLNPDTVITETSDIDDIAQMQLLAEAVDYVPGNNIGFFDNDLEQLCRDIQQELFDLDKRVIVNGYCDIFVERYLRSKNEVKAEVY
jgi:hypothetical protein